MTLSPAATTILTRAAERADRLLQFHRKLPALARGKMIDALRRDGLIRGETSFGDCDLDTGLILTSLELTDEGLRAMGREPSTALEATTPTATPTAPLAPQEPSPPLDSDQATNAVCESSGARTSHVGAKASLRYAAAALLAAHDAGADLAQSIDARRMALSGAKPPRTTTPRTNTKQSTVLALLRRGEGATIAQIVEATGWQQHTVRGFLAGLMKKGMTIETIEQVRVADRGVAPSQPALYHENDPTHHAAVIHTGDAVGLREVWAKQAHLSVRQKKRDGHGGTSANGRINPRRAGSSYLLGPEPSCCIV